MGNNLIKRKKKNSFQNVNTTFIINVSSAIFTLQMLLSGGDLPAVQIEKKRMFLFCELLWPYDIEMWLKTYVITVCIICKTS